MFVCGKLFIVCADVVLVAHVCQGNSWRCFLVKGPEVLFLLSVCWLCSVADNTPTRRGVQCVDVHQLLMCSIVVRYCVCCWFLCVVLVCGARLRAFIIDVHPHRFLDVRSSDTSTRSGANVSNLCTEHDATECE